MIKKTVLLTIIISSFAFAGGIAKAVPSGHMLTTTGYKMILADDDNGTVQDDQSTTTDNQTDTQDDQATTPDNQDQADQPTDQNDQTSDDSSDDS